MSTKKNENAKSSKAKTKKSKSAAKPKTKAKNATKSKAKKKTKQIRMVGHEKLQKLLDGFGGNVSELARHLDFVMPAVLRWVKNNSVPLYSSRKRLHDKGFQYSDWTTPAVG